MFLTSIFAIDIFITIALLILAYFIGSIPFGVLLGKKLAGIDIREHGSKNTGSTNAIRVLGKKIGYLVFLCDVLKGMLIIIVVKILKLTSAWESPIDQLYYGLCAIIGHCFSVFLHFKGGKAVATSLGVVLVLTPTPALICLVVFLLVLKTTGYVSLASTFAAISVCISGWLFYAFGIEATNFLEYFIIKPELSTAIVYSILVLFILFKHRTNYVRLLNGTENCFKKKKDETK